MDTKAAVRRFIDEAVNGGRDELIDELVTEELRSGVREWFGSFRGSFPDVRMETVELVADGDTVVGRFTCSGTHLGEWLGHAPTGRRFTRIDEVYFFTFNDNGKIVKAWGLEDTLKRLQQLGLA